jgi:DNA polymerase I
MSQRKPKLMIIDGNAIIHRSFHALPLTMATKTGEITNAVYGFTTVLVKAIREMKPDYIVLTLDRAAPTFRHLEYKEYKTNRIKAPDELYEQIPRVREVAEALNIPIYEKDGLEADDLIGIIANNTKDIIDKIILTGDLDTLQLVNAHTKVYTMSRGLSESVVYDERLIMDRYGLRPDQLVDYKGLRGDPSDNIPGVKGIGEKTATELLKEFKTLENIYEFIDAAKALETKIKPRIIDLLRQQRQEAFLSRKLATIKLEGEIGFDLEAAKFGHIDQEKIIELFSELEFRSLLPRVKGLITDDENRHPEAGEQLADNKFERNKRLFRYLTVDSEKDFAEFHKKLSRQEKFTFDTETTGLEPLISQLLGISFSWKEGEAYYINFQFHPSREYKPISNFQKENLFNYQSSKINNNNINQPWLDKLKPIFEDGKIKKSGHNMKFDIRVMRKAGIDVMGENFDTMIASYLLNPGSRQHNLDALTFSELGFEKISKDDLLGKGREKITFSEIPTENLSLYSCEDADFTNRLVNRLKKSLRENDLEKLFSSIEMPLVKILAKMEDSGIKIDGDYLKKLGVKVNKKISEIEKKIWKIAGTQFNISSPLQLREILFEKLKISTSGIGKTKTGISTAADELTKMKNEHQIIPMISEYRELSKLANTYIDTLPKLINQNTGRVHTSFNQAVTATGRLSSTEPNIQNIPVRTELGNEIRKAFRAEKGYILLSLDYSQIELRLAAHMSGDKKMIGAFAKGVDIHTATAAEINDVTLDKVTKSMRREAKAINFGLLYGQGPRGLSQTADIPYERAKQFIAHYFKSYKGIEGYIESSIELAREKGYAETLFGRRRYLPEINSSVMQVQKNAERMAINTPLQGTAADMIKVAMIDVSEFLSDQQRMHEIFRKKLIDSDIKMLLQVHDELLFEVRTELAGKAATALKQIMEKVIKLKAPIVVDASSGENWGEMKKLEVGS